MMVHSLLAPRCLRSALSCALVLVCAPLGCGDDIGAVQEGSGGNVAGGGSGAGPSGGAASGGDDDCVPSSCGARCGELDDGCGLIIDCGGCSAAGESCGGSGVPNECGAPAVPPLAQEQGCFFTVNSIGEIWEAPLGEVGTTYASLAFEYDVMPTSWREDVFDRPVLNHGLFDLRRDVGPFVGRYILGNAAQIKPDAANLARRSIFYARVDLEPKPQGQGWTGYTSFRDNMAWQLGETYHVSIELDAVAAKQTLVISRNGQEELTTVGDIPYFEPSLTTSGFIVKFGGTESNEREVQPLGWSFCDFIATGVELP